MTQENHGINEARLVISGRSTAPLRRRPLLLFRGRQGRLFALDIVDNKVSDAPLADPAFELAGCLGRLFGLATVFCWLSFRSSLGRAKAFLCSEPYRIPRAPHPQP